MEENLKKMNIGKLVKSRHSRENGNPANLNYDDPVKSLIQPIIVIPVKTGIQ